MYELLAIVSVMMAVSANGGSLVGLLLWEAVWISLFMFSVAKMEEQDENSD